MTSTPHSSMPVATILDSLEDPALDINEHTFLAYGDDLLDFVIGLDVYCKNRWLLDADPLPTGVYHGDAVCVGSGPSLDLYLPKLKEIQDQVLIVAAHSAISKLLSHGITPHLITPKERLPDPAKIPEMLPESVVYAGLPLVPCAPYKCHRHFLVGDSGRIADWLGIHRPDVKITTTSGSLSAWVASVVATGAIWLVGHDLAHGHYSGFAHKEETAKGTIPCVDGVDRPSVWVYRGVRDELVRLAAERRVVQCSPHGALIEGALNGPLEPTLAGKPVLLPRIVPQDHKPHAGLASIPAMFDRVISVAENAKSHTDMSMQSLFNKRDQLLGQTIMQPVWLQFSILKRTIPSLTSEQIFRGMQGAILNTFRCLRPWARKTCARFAE